MSGFIRNNLHKTGIFSISPDSITVSGPDNVVSTIHFISTQPLYFTNLTDTVTTYCKLEPVKSLTYSVQKVKVVLPVDRFTEVEDNFPVQTVNVPDSLTMIAIPGQVKITYHICLSNYQQMLHNPLLPRINYKDISRCTFRPVNRIFSRHTPGDQQCKVKSAMKLNS